MDSLDLVGLLGGLGSAGKVALVVLTWLGVLVVVAQGVVALTPTTKDDEAWAKILSIPVLGSLLQAIAKLAPFQKK